MKKLLLSLALGTLVLTATSPTAYCLPIPIGIPTEERSSDDRCPSAKATEDRCGVSDQQCIDYLTGLGYTNVAVSSYQSCNTICSTSNPYHTKVIIQNGTIINYEDMPD